ALAGSLPPRPRPPGPGRRDRKRQPPGRLRRRSLRHGRHRLRPDRVRPRPAPADRTICSARDPNTTRKWYAPHGRSPRPAASPAGNLREAFPPGEHEAATYGARGGAYPFATFSCVTPGSPGGGGLERKGAEENGAAPRLRQGGAGRPPRHARPRAVHPRVRTGALAPPPGEAARVTDQQLRVLRGHAFQGCPRRR